MRKTHLHGPIAEKKSGRLDLLVRHRLGKLLRDYYKTHLTKELPPRLQTAIKKLLENEGQGSLNLDRR